MIFVVMMVVRMTGMMFSKMHPHKIRPYKNRKYSPPKTKLKIPDGKKPSDGPQSSEHILMIYNYVVHTIKYTTSGTVTQILFYIKFDLP